MFGVSSCRALELFWELLPSEGTCNCTPSTENCHGLVQEAGHWVLQEPDAMEGKKCLDNPSFQKKATLPLPTYKFRAIFLQIHTTVHWLCEDCSLSKKVGFCLCSLRQCWPSSFTQLPLISPSRNRSGCHCSVSSFHFQPAAMEFSFALMPPVLRFHCPINASTNDLWNLLGATLKTSET